MSKKTEEILAKIAREKKSIIAEANKAIPAPESPKDKSRPDPLVTKSGQGHGSGKLSDSAEKTIQSVNETPDQGTFNPSSKTIETSSPEGQGAKPPVKDKNGMHDRRPLDPEAKKVIEEAREEFLNGTQNNERD